MQIPMLLGREIDDHDQPNSQAVAVVSELFAKTTFGDENPVGRHLTMAGRIFTSHVKTSTTSKWPPTSGLVRLTDKQVVQLSAIMDQTRSQFRELQEKMAPELLAIQQQENAKIRDILTIEQNAEFDKLIQERKEKQRAKKARR